MRRTRTNYAIRFILASAVGIALMGFREVAEAALFIAIIITGIQIYLAIGRLKDMNANPWWSALVILPFVGLILMFPGGTKGANQYGEDPRDQQKS